MVKDELRHPLEIPYFPSFIMFVLLLDDALCNIMLSVRKFIAVRLD